MNFMQIALHKKCLGYHVLPKWCLTPFLENMVSGRCFKNLDLLVRAEELAAANNQTVT